MKLLRPFIKKGKDGWWNLWIVYYWNQPSLLAYRPPREPFSYYTYQSARKNLHRYLDDAGLRLPGVEWIEKY